MCDIELLLLNFVQIHLKLATVLKAYDECEAFSSNQRACLTECKLVWQTLGSTLKEIIFF